MGGTRERGVTLLELLVAMFLLAVALMGLAASFPMAMFGVTSGGYQTTATLIGQQCLDIAKNIPWASVSATALGSACPAAPEGFTRVISVNAGETATMKVVNIEIGFPVQTGINSTNLTTILTQ